MECFHTEVRVSCEEEYVAVHPFAVALALLELLIRPFVLGNKSRGLGVFLSQVGIQPPLFVLSSLW